MLKKQVGTLVGLLFLAGCDNAPDKLAALTTSEDGRVYENSYFGLSVEKPEGWYAANMEEQIMIQQQGGKMMAGGNKNLENILEASLDTTLPLFSFFELPPGSPVEVNPNVIGYAENLGVGARGVKTGCDYLYHAKKIISQAAVDYEFSDSCGEVSINGVTFGYYDATFNIGLGQFKQRFLACISEGYAIGVVESYGDDASWEKVKLVTDKLQVDCAG